MGIITAIAGTGLAGYNLDGGIATTVLLNYPAGLAISSMGDVMFADTNNNVVRKVSKVYKFHLKLMWPVERLRQLA